MAHQKRWIFGFFLIIGFVATDALAQISNFWMSARAYQAIQREKTDTSVFAYHSPIYPRSNETVTYTATARPPTGQGIKSLRVSILVYEVSESGDRLSYSGPVMDTAYDCQWTAPYPTLPQTCQSDPINLPANSYVWYSATLTLSDDSVRKDRRIRHAAKLSEDVIDDGYGEAIPIYRRGKHAKKFDILFTRDVDYTRLQDFTDEMGQFLWSGYFGLGPLNAYRRYFNIYMNDYSNSVDIENPDGNRCSDHTIYAEPDEAPRNADDLPWVDVHVFAHQTDFQDCAHIRLGGGSEASADNDNITTVAHETLHALAGMDDEYPTDADEEASSDAIGPHFNTFTTAEGCYDHAQDFHAYDYWWNSDQCRTLGALPDLSLLYHWDGDIDIMTSTGVLSHEEIAQLDTLIEDQNLSAFSRMPDMVVRQTGRELSQEVLREARQSIEDDLSEWQAERQARALKIKLVFAPNMVKLKDARILRGSAPNLFLPDQPSDYLISLLDAQGNVVEQFYTPDPKRSCDGDVFTGEAPGRVEASSFDYKVAWDVRFTHVKVEDKAGRVLLHAPLGLGKAAPPARR